MSGKRLQVIKKSLTPEKHYSLDDAISFLKEKSVVKFDETVEVAIKLGIDPRHSDQMVRGVTSLPNGTGKNIRVAVFAKGEKVEEAKEAGAEIAGEDDLIAEVKKGNIDFDRCIATPDMMGKVGALGKILGPKGLMPNPKLGTVTINVAEAVKAVKSGQIEYKVDKKGIIHAGVGKISFAEKKIKENIVSFISAIQKARPSGAKGTYLLAIYLTSTMGPGIRIDLSSISS